MAAMLLVLAVLAQQRTRTIEGTWIDLFEGSAFFEGGSIASACSPAFRNAPWFAYYPKPDTAEGKLVIANRGSGVFVSSNGEWPMAAYHVKFVGHHQLVGLTFGHMGSFPSEFAVDRMISIKPVAVARCDVRPA